MKIKDGAYPKRRKETLEENRKQIVVACGQGPKRPLTAELMKELKDIEILTDKRRTEIKN